ncbi:hypothetical protein MTsDn1_02200 [Alteromonas sp. MTD1]|uniref:hypothetical protein n=1 Tax=unclassified Alteromonas TaxID=2614992 RepID=UPI002FE0D1AB
MRKYLVLILMFQSFCSYALDGCFDMQGFVVKAGEKNSLGIEALVSCGRLTDLCDLYIRVPSQYDTAAIIYDLKDTEDSELYIPTPVYNWDEEYAKKEYRSPSDIVSFLSPKFHGVHIQIKKDYAVHSTLYLTEANGCEFIDVENLSGWFK